MTVGVGVGVREIVGLGVGDGETNGINDSHPLLSIIFKVNDVVPTNKYGKFKLIGNVGVTKVSTKTHS